jgi:hypothetical protein
MKVRYIIVAFFILSIDKSSPIINRTLASVTVSYCLLGFCIMFISIVKKSLIALQEKTLRMFMSLNKLSNCPTSWLQM